MSSSRAQTLEYTEVGEEIEPDESAEQLGGDREEPLEQLGRHTRRARGAESRAQRVRGESVRQVQDRQGEAAQVHRERRRVSAQAPEAHQLRQGHARVRALRARRRQAQTRALSSAHAQQVPSMQSAQVRRPDQEVAQTVARVGRESRGAQGFQVFDCRLGRDERKQGPNGRIRLHEQDRGQHVVQHRRLRYSRRRDRNE